MALNRDFVGRTYPPSAPYEVSRVKIREFAAAIGDHNPLYRDQEAAQAAGYPDVIAPPTFPIVFSLQSGGGALVDPDLGLNLAMVVHGEQRFEYTRPVHMRRPARHDLHDHRHPHRRAQRTAHREERRADGRG